MACLAKRLLVVGCRNIATPSSRHPVLVGLLSCWLAGTPLQEPVSALPLPVSCHACVRARQHGDGDVLCRILHRRARGSVTYVTRLRCGGDDAVPKAQARRAEKTLAAVRQGVLCARPPTPPSFRILSEKHAFVTASSNCGSATSLPSPSSSSAALGDPNQYLPRPSALALRPAAASRRRWPDQESASC